MAFILLSFFPLYVLSYFSKISSINIHYWTGANRFKEGLSRSRVAVKNMQKRKINNNFWLCLKVLGWIGGLLNLLFYSNSVSFLWFQSRSCLCSLFYY